MTWDGWDANIERQPARRRSRWESIGPGAVETGERHVAASVQRFRAALVRRSRAVGACVCGSIPTEMEARPVRVPDLGTNLFDYIEPSDSPRAIHARYLPSEL